MTEGGRIVQRQNATFCNNWIKDGKCRHENNCMYLDGHKKVCLAWDHKIRKNGCKDRVKCALFHPNPAFVVQHRNEYRGRIDRREISHHRNNNNINRKDERRFYNNRDYKDERRIRFLVFFFNIIYCIDKQCLKRKRSRSKDPQKKEKSKRARTR